MAGLPPALLSKYHTPLEIAAERLNKYVPLGTSPNLLTQGECDEIHAIYQEAIQRTQELEDQLRGVLKKLAERSRGIRRNSTPADVAADHSSLRQPQAKAMRRSGGVSTKRRKATLIKAEEKRLPANQLPTWATRTPRPGDPVVAKLDDENLYIWAKMERYFSTTKEFLVVDEDGEGDKKRRELRLKRSSIFSLPREDEASGAIFPVGCPVMALYPHTTTFYPAQISRPFVESRVSRQSVLTQLRKPYHRISVIVDLSLDKCSAIPFLSDTASPDVLINNRATDI